MLGVRISAKLQIMGNFSDRYSNDIEEDRLFRLTAPHYDEVQETIATEIRATFANHPSEVLSMLEIGCGTGLTTEIILQADPRIHLKAIDNEAGIVEAAQLRFEDKETDRLSIICADALEYLKQQKNESFDAILSAMVLHNLPAKYRREVYVEIWRTLKKEGLFMNVDKYAQEHEEEHQKALAWQLEQFTIFDEVGRPDQHEKWRKHYLEDEKPEVILREDDFIHDLKSLGFSDLTRVYRCQMEASYIARKF